MTTAFEKRIRKLSPLSDKALLGTDGYFYVFGEDITGCLYADGQMSKKVSKEQVLRIRRETPPSLDDDDYYDYTEADLWKQNLNTKQNIKELFEKAARTYEIKYDELLAEFPITDVKRRALANRIIDEDATHFQIDCDGKEIRAHCFDVRSTIGSSLLKQEELLGANGLYLKAGKIPFKFSVDATAWSKLPKEGATAKIYSNGIMRLEYHDDAIRISIRDQEIRRPHTAFYSERMKKRVLFLFHPKKGTLVKEA